MQFPIKCRSLKQRLAMQAGARRDHGAGDPAGDDRCGANGITGEAGNTDQPGSHQLGARALGWCEMPPAQALAKRFGGPPIAAHGTEANAQGSQRELTRAHVRRPV
jgi:hypothetical protein